MASIVITSKDFRALPPTTQAALLAHFAPSASRAEPDVTSASELPDLSVNQARKLLEGCSERTKAVLRFIATKPAAGFSLNSVAEHAKVDDPADLVGIWRGISKRTGTVLSDPGTKLIEWDDNPADEDDQLGRISPTTYASLRKALGLG